MAATIAIAEIALVSDISGVWSSGETRRMTSRPRKVARRKTKSFGSRLCMATVSCQLLMIGTAAYEFEVYAIVHNDLLSSFLR